MQNLWIRAMMAGNTVIKQRNETNKAQRSLIYKRFDEQEEQKASLWGAIASSMEKDSLDKVKAFVQGVPGEEGHMTYDIAMGTWDWIFLFRAAEHTHLQLDDLMFPATRSCGSAK